MSLLRTPPKRGDGVVTRSRAAEEQCMAKREHENKRSTSQRSNKTSCSSAAARKQLEFEAAQRQAQIDIELAEAEKMAELAQAKKKAIIEKSLIEKKLEVELANLEEKSNDYQSSKMSLSRVGDWLARQNSAPAQANSARRGDEDCVCEDRHSESSGSDPGGGDGTFVRTGGAPLKGGTTHADTGGAFVPTFDVRPSLRDRGCPDRMCPDRMCPDRMCTDRMCTDRMCFDHMSPPQDGGNAPRNSDIKELVDVLKQVLPKLASRRKWQQEGTQLKKGDVVVVVDPSSPRNCWPKGIIQSVYPGADGRVRVVDVKTKTGVLKRPAARIAILNPE